MRCSARYAVRSSAVRDSANIASIAVARPYVLNEYGGWYSSVRIVNADGNVKEDRESGSLFA